MAIRGVQDLNGLEEVIKASIFEGEFSSDTSDGQWAVRRLANGRAEVSLDGEKVFELTAAGNNGFTVHSLYPSVDEATVAIVHEATGRPVKSAFAQELDDLFAQMDRSMKDMTVYMNPQSGILHVSPTRELEYYLETHNDMTPIVTVSRTEEGELSLSFHQGEDFDDVAQAIVLEAGKRNIPVLNAAEVAPPDRGAFIAPMFSHVDPSPVLKVTELSCEIPSSPVDRKPMLIPTPDVTLDFSEYGEVFLRHASEEQDVSSVIERLMPEQGGTFMYIHTKECYDTDSEGKKFFHPVSDVSHISQEEAAQILSEMYAHEGELIAVKQHSLETVDLREQYAKEHDLQGIVRNALHEIQLDNVKNAVFDLLRRDTAISYQFGAYQAHIGVNLQTGEQYIQVSDSNRGGQHNVVAQMTMQRDALGVVYPHELTVLNNNGMSSKVFNTDRRVGESLERAIVLYNQYTHNVPDPKNDPTPVFEIPDKKPKHSKQQDVER